MSNRSSKRQKNDAADAEVIVEAAQRPTMRFVEIKSEEQQSRAIVFRTREQLVNQRTELVNALRAHLYEFGAMLLRKASATCRVWQKSLRTRTRDCRIWSARSAAICWARSTS
uniref:IS110 family transposase n=1 Tax=Mesorhizobium silamurunense TaxID=499528 RepID=UPI00177D0C7C|nr:transposase [Mesorhizobium silamurunense]